MKFKIKEIRKEIEKNHVISSQDSSIGPALLPSTPGQNVASIDDGTTSGIQMLSGNLAGVFTRKERQIETSAHFK
jgi:hypothetical protein